MFIIFYVQDVVNLIRFRSMSFFIPPESQNFRMFLGGIKMEHWLEMVQQLIYSKPISHNVSIFLILGMTFPQPHLTQHFHCS